MNITSQQQFTVLTGIVGVIAAILVGIGEFLLHFDPLARFSIDSYAFMLAASDEHYPTHALDTLLVDLHRILIQVLHGKL